MAHFLCARGGGYPKCPKTPANPIAARVLGPRQRIDNASTLAPRSPGRTGRRRADGRQTRRGEQRHADVAGPGRTAQRRDARRAGGLSALVVCRVHFFCLTPTLHRGGFCARAAPPHPPGGGVGVKNPDGPYPAVWCVGVKNPRRVFPTPRPPRAQKSARRFGRADSRSPSQKSEYAAGVWYHRKPKRGAGCRGFF
jgi:hypothetical protein